MHIHMPFTTKNCNEKLEDRYNRSVALKAMRLNNNFQFQ